jgi:heme iron utilization protein
MAEAQRDHAYTERSLAEPLAEVAGAPRRSAAEEARTLLAGTSVASLATLSDGAPWASLVQTGVLEDGGVVLCVSTLAEHGRNLLEDPRASVLVAAPEAGDDALARGRVTLAGIAHRPEGAARDAARAAYCARVPYAEGYVDFGDFSLWVLEVERVRWVGGYGRMASAEAADYAAARPDPVAPHAARAVAHLNEDHADALLAMVRALGGHPDATAATCMAADRLGLDLEAATPRGRAITRVGFAAPIDEPGGLRAATVELTRRSRELLA